MNKINQEKLIHTFLSSKRCYTATLEVRLHQGIIVIIFHNQWKTVHFGFSSDDSNEWFEKKFEILKRCINGNANPFDEVRELEIKYPNLYI